MKWSSNFGFIISTIGAAVGLGSLWRFPYTVGANGGASFILLFLLLTLLVAFPLFLTEMMMGMMGRKNAAIGMGNMAHKYGRTKRWSLFGYIGNITLVLILSFYSIVSSWCVVYLVYSFMGSYNGLDLAGANHLWEETISHPIPLLMAHTLFMFLNIHIVKKDIQKGIERYSLILMPSLFFMLIALIAYNAKSFGLNQAAHFLFVPDFSKINFTVTLNALGQAFFSLAVGAGCITMYASYQETQTHFIRQASIIAISNIAVSIIAGLAIFPIVFSYGLQPDEGANLIFKTLPLVLGQVQFGQWIGVVLFLLFLFAALTSSISLLEPPASLLAEFKNLGKEKAAYSIGFISWAFGAVYIFEDQLFAQIANISTNIMLPIGALGFSIFIGWVIPKDKIAPLLNNAPLYFLIKWVAPMGVSIILLSQLL